MRLISETPHPSAPHDVRHHALGFDVDGRTLRVTGTLEAGLHWRARFHWDNGEEGNTPICFAYVPAIDGDARFYADFLMSADLWRPILTTLDPTGTASERFVISQ